MEPWWLGVVNAHDVLAMASVARSTGGRWRTMVMDWIVSRAGKGESENGNRKTENGDAEAEADVDRIETIDTWS